MKHVDPVMQELWRAKDANAAKHKSLPAYIAFLARQGNVRHGGDAPAAPARRLRAGKVPLCAGPT